MLSNLNSRLSAMLGTGWIDDSFDVQAKFDVLRAIPYNEKPDLDALVEVCNAFFGEGNTEYFSIELDHIIINKIPERYDAGYCAIIPYKFVPATLENRSRTEHARICYIPRDKKSPTELQKLPTNIDFYNTDDLVFQMCHDFIKDGESKDKLIEMLDKHDGKRKREDDEESIRREKLENERLREQMLVQTLTTGNDHFKNWIKDWKKTKLGAKFYPVQLKILQAIQELMQYPEP
jgi:hypothetical protein